MWYEILPTFITITTFLSIPNIFVYYTAKMLLGQPYRRRIATREECFLYLRDGRLSDRNWAYDFFALENIPDMEQPKEQPQPTSSS